LRLRLSIINDIKNYIKRRKESYLKSKNIEQLLENLKYLKQSEIEKLTSERDFIALRKEIIRNISSIYHEIN